MDQQDTVYQVGIPERFREDAVLLYEEAFGAKFRVAIRSRERRLRVLSESLCLSFGIAAILEGTLVGVAGFKHGKESLTGGMTFRRLIQVLGFFPGLWAAFVFSLYERSGLSGQLLMDGISVREDARGRGIGGNLLEQVERYAAAQGLSSVRLDVIDTNPGAKRLYLRKGFRVTAAEPFEYLRWFFGFGGSETLVKQLDSVGQGADSPS